MLSRYSYILSIQLHPRNLTIPIKKSNSWAVPPPCWQSTPFDLWLQEALIHHHRLVLPAPEFLKNQVI